MKSHKASTRQVSENERHSTRLNSRPTFALRLNPHVIALFALLRSLCHSASLWRAQLATETSSCMLNGVSYLRATALIVNVALFTVVRQCAKGGAATVRSEMQRIALERASNPVPSASASDRRVFRRFAYSRNLARSKITYRFDVGPYQQYGLHLYNGERHASLPL